MQLTDNFHIDEFKCKDGTPVPPEYYDNVKFLAEELQVLRDFLNADTFYEFKILINSAYRTELHNELIGGSPKSQHLTASAADIRVFGCLGGSDDWEQIEPEYVAKTIDVLARFNYMEQGGIGQYETFTHYDIRGEKVRWNG